MLVGSQDITCDHFAAAGGPGCTHARAHRETIGHAFYWPMCPDLPLEGR